MDVPAGVGKWLLPQPQAEEPGRKSPPPVRQVRARFIHAGPVCNDDGVLAPRRGATDQAKPCANGLSSTWPLSSRSKLPSKMPVADSQPSCCGEGSNSPARNCKLPLTALQRQTTEENEERRHSKHVMFAQTVPVEHDVTPYSRVYGMRPSHFEFDRKGEMQLTNAGIMHELLLEDMPSSPTKAEAAQASRQAFKPNDMLSSPTRAEAARAHASAGDGLNAFALPAVLAPKGGSQVAPPSSTAPPLPRRPPQAPRIAAWDVD